MAPRLKLLLEKSMAGTASQAERSELMSMLDDAVHGDAIQDYIGLLLEDKFPAESLSAETLDRIAMSLTGVDRLASATTNPIAPSAEQPMSEAMKQALGLPAEQPIQRSMLRWWAAAAGVIMVLGIGAYLLLSNQKNLPIQNPVTQTVNKPPAVSGAILTLSDGSKVVLDSLHSGIIATQNGAQVSLNNGRLDYRLAGTASSEVSYNTITTPNGRQFQVMLPDGTKVWLNAASSITYPTFFAGKQRLVTISGEAYFEVTGNSHQPFAVNVNDQAAIEVLGTRFNVNAYPDENSINTTLLEGSVRTYMGEKSKEAMAVTLKPGQQARIANEQTTKASGSVAKNGIQIVNDADPEKIIAWKNGLFNFQGLGLGEVMRQLARWYDIRVQYNNSAPNLVFGGEMYRNVNLSDVLDMFKDMGVQYKWDGKTLTVL